MMRKKIFCTGLTTEKPRQNKNLFYRHDEPNEPTKEGPLSFVLFESPFISVSTVSRGHPSLVFLVLPWSVGLVSMDPEFSNQYILSRCVVLSRR
jgi:hypothetical protein